MELYLVSRQTAKKAYQQGYKVHIGTFSKRYVWLVAY